MKKFTTILFIFFISIMLSVSAYAETAKDAIMGLKKLQARCQSGISYRDYSNALGEAKFPVNLFMESAEAKKIPELTDSIKIVMGHYEYAGYIWHEKIAAISKSTPDPVEYWLTLGWIPTLGPLGRELTKRYPGIKTFGENYLVDSALETIWATAAQELENTTKLYAKTEGNSSSEVDKLKKEIARLQKENDALKAKQKKK